MISQVSSLAMRPTIFTPVNHIWSGKIKIIKLLTYLDFVGEFDVLRLYLL